MNESISTNGWNEYQKLVLNELERHNKLIESIRYDLSDIKTEIAMLKVKSGLWGMVGAAIPVGIAIAMKLINFE